MTMVEEYLREVDLAENLYEFHHEAFMDLDATDREALVEYYGLEVVDIQDFRKYRNIVTSQNARLEERAKAAYRRLAASLGMCL
ncbi:hypothetical protein SK803_04070 [Lentzea sp. BCCO 10_0856]|uniref:Uncharacterized protein n=1 Tax=Lentzea miocenica TaxID=3095431 RepID=A0ABU4SU02_9PSEU|nr:hypothetical protein [Lentzea sp. BCCO 10_0856]MDX8029370.1 hypothetical protein [Lentzea sp. BCCO 10_0856]